MRGFKRYACRVLTDEPEQQCGGAGTGAATGKLAVGGPDQPGATRLDTWMLPAPGHFLLPGPKCALQLTLYRHKSYDELSRVPSFSQAIHSGKDNTSCRKVNVHTLTTADTAINTD